MDLSLPFRGSVAVAAGVLTPAVIRGRRFRRVFPDVYVAAHVELDLATRSRAAFVYADGRGVLVRHSAAELWGASCGRKEAPAELTLPGSERRARPGLFVHRFRPDPDEVAEFEGTALTTPLRTAYDLGRLDDLTEAVVALDALSHGRFPPAAVSAVAARHPGDRHLGRLGRALGLADARSESPMESRIRLAIVRYGLPPPELQFAVGVHRLDLAYPELRLAVEYDGREHLTAARARKDLRREAALTAYGWAVVRIPAHVVFNPWLCATTVKNELRARGWNVVTVSPAW